VLLLEVSEAIIRSGKCLPTRRKMTCICALEVNCVYVAFEIFVQSKSLGVGTTSDSAPECTVVCSGVLFEVTTA